jgi:hypothetical protein
METGLNTVVIVWDKSPHDRWVFTERDVKRLGVRIGTYDDAAKR